MSVLNNEALRNEVLSRIKKILQIHNHRLARGEEPCFFVSHRTAENSILKFLDGGTEDPVIQVRDRRNIRVVENQGSLQMVKILQIAEKLLTEEKSLTQRSLIPVC
jgi:hypothetical protein